VISIGGITAFPGLSMYHASKWALEGFSQSLAQEVRPFGIHVTLIEPGGFDTDGSGSSADRVESLPAYAEVGQAIAERRRSAIGKRGNPAATRGPVLKIVDAEKPPLRVFFGPAPLGIAKADYESRLALWEEWNAVAIEAQG
jgi:NAD(P)-dependent dehydrogenase (short-subunit alcohol dehydrogenase family)